MKLINRLFVERQRRQCLTMVVFSALSVGSFAQPSENVSSAKKDVEASVQSQGVAGADQVKQTTTDQAKATVNAAAERDMPHKVVESVTEELLTIVKGGEQALKDDPEKYFGDVQVILDKVVHFEFIAKNVMGSYWLKATPEQQQAFVSVFRRSLVKTYAKGMATFANWSFSVEPPKDPTKIGRKTTVKQVVRGPDGVNIVAYTLIWSKKASAWRLTNVVLDGVNLGKTFRTQFGQLVKEHKNNVAKAIENWSA